MKKIKTKQWSIIAMMAVIMMSLAACGDDDGVGSKAKLIGTWRQLSYEEWGTINGKLDYEETKDYTTGDYVKYYTFYEDGTLKATSISNGRKSESNGTWDIKNGKFYWSNYGDFDYNDLDDIYKISKLTNTTLIIEYGPYTDYSDGDKYVDYEKYTFERVSDLD
jgi:hypothetical protein